MGTNEPGFITASLAGDPRMTSAGVDPGPMQSTSRVAEPTAGGEELARLNHLASNVVDQVERLEARLARILAAQTPQPAPGTVPDRPSRPDGAPTSSLADELHEVNERLALACRRIDDLHQRIDV